MDALLWDRHIVASRVAKPKGKPGCQMKVPGISRVSGRQRKGVRVVGDLVVDVCLLRS